LKHVFLTGIRLIFMILPLNMIFPALIIIVLSYDCIGISPNVEKNSIFCRAFYFLRPANPAKRRPRR
jgi:hypothetical protein